MTIRANHVTFARLLSMPFLALLLYADDWLLVLGVVLGALIGLTDTLDGYLARKYGITSLGGLMDPIADKVFIAAAFLPYVDRGWAPWWFAASVLLREFLVNALRTGLAHRGGSQPSSFLGKVKTWVQMLGVGLLFMVAVVEHAWIIHSVLWGLVLIAAVGGVVALELAKGAWRHAWVGVLPAAGLASVYTLWGAEGFNLWSVIFIVGFTWLSAVDYFTGAGRQLRIAGAAQAFTLLRLLAAAIFPVLATAALVWTPAPAWAVIAMASAELAHGGLDSFLARRGAAMSAGRWGGRYLVMVLLLLAVFLVPGGSVPLAAIACGVSLADVLWAFARNHRLFLTAITAGEKSTTGI